MVAVPPDPSPAGAREWLGLALVALAALTTSIDVSVVLLAIPRIAQDLGAGSSEQLWIVDIYGFLLAGLLITSGSLADRWGRRRMMMLGAAVFGAGSLLAAFSPTVWLLIGARAVCGIGAAALTPALYGLISSAFRRDRERSVALGVFMACFMGGMILGPLVGGVLLARLPWGAVFLLGVPVMALLLMLSPVLLRETPRSAAPGAIDGWSVGLSLGAVLSIVAGMTEAARVGIRPMSAAEIVVGLVLAAVFVRRQALLAERGTRPPLLDLGLFRRRGVGLVLLSLSLMTLLTGPLMLLNTQYFQLVEGVAPLEAGLLTVPSSAVSALGFVVAPLLGRRIRPGIVIGAGLILVASALILIARTTPQSGPWPLVVGFGLVSLGAAPLPTLGTNIVVGSVSTRAAASAASVSETSGQLGYALGIAAVGSLVTLVYRLEVPALHGLSGSREHTAEQSIAGAVRVARLLSPDAAEHLRAAASDAFCSGIQVVAAIGAVVTAALGIACMIRLRHIAAFGK